MKSLSDALFIASRLLGHQRGLSRILQIHPAQLLHDLSTDRFIMTTDNNKQQTSSSSTTTTLTYRYQIPAHITTTHSKESAVPSLFPLSGYLCLFDDITTWAIVQRDRFNRPGVSTSLQLERGPAAVRGRGLRVGDVVDIHARVVKIGKNMGFANAEAIHVDSGEVICRGKHTKFLPMGVVAETIIGRLAPLTRQLVTLIPPRSDAEEEQEEEEGATTLEELLSFEGMDDDGRRAVFNVGRDHVNSYGSLHGACQAMLMEKLGRETLQRSFGLQHPLLSSISLSYISSGRKGVSLDVTPIDVGRSGASMEVVMRDEGSRSIVSEGFLRWDVNEMGEGKVMEEMSKL